MIEMPKPAKRPRPYPVVHFPDASYLWERWTAYKDLCAATKISIGSRGRTVNKPLTLAGFAVFVNCSEGTLTRAATRDDLKETWATIKSEILDNLVTYGLAKQYDPMLVARVAKLSDSKHVTTKDETAPMVERYDFSKLTVDEMETLTTLLTKATIDQDDNNG